MQVAPYMETRRSSGPGFPRSQMERLGSGRGDGKRNSRLDAQARPSTRRVGTPGPSVPTSIPRPGPCWEESAMASTTPTPTRRALPKRRLARRSRTEGVCSTRGGRSWPRSCLTRLVLISLVYLFGEDCFISSAAFCCQLFEISPHAGVALSSTSRFELVLQCT